MMKYKYNGTDERVFPSIGITVKPGDEFDAPDGFVAIDVEPAGAHSSAPKPSIPKPTEPITTVSAASDKKLGE
jgi:hypothetical protein